MSAGAQSADAAQCFGFSFGAWNPPLDLRTAGHDTEPSTATQIKAPGGRDWAASDVTPNDTTLLLFPAWWPAGVQVIFSRRPTATDTVAGRAMALVADGRATPPRATMRAWRVPCR
ncbi:MAG: hypothetical protein ACT4P6_15380 [Gemmatimonadaceae bacterium]